MLRLHSEVVISEREKLTPMCKIVPVKNIWCTKAEVQFSRNVSIQGSHTENRWHNRIIPQIQVS